MNSYERDAHAAANRRATRAYEALLDAGASKGDAADTAARVYDQEFRFELQEAYGMDDRELREDLETFARCLEPEDES